LGRAFVRSFLTEHPELAQIRVMARDELKYYQFSLEFPSESFPKLQSYVGDVRDFDRVKEISSGVDIVIHAAAMKHLNYCENNPGECLKTNYEGTRNVVKAVLENKVSRAILVSTDKAVEPVSVYGNSKQAAERIFQSKSDDTSKLSVIRLGNIWSSNGSVLPHFMKLKKSGLLPLKHAESTRFFGTVSETFQTLLFALGSMKGGEVYIPKWSSVKILDIARIVCGDDCKIAITHLENYERVHEKLLSGNEITRAFENSDHLMVPCAETSQNQALDNYGMLKTRVGAYSSEDPQHLLSDNNLRKQLEELTPLEANGHSHLTGISN